MKNLQGPNGKITYNTIKKVFFARGHPDFQSGKFPDYQIRDEFFEILDGFLSLSGGVNDYLPADLLLQFFEIYSFAYDDDRFFSMIIKGSFRLNKNAFPVIDYSETYSKYDAQSTHSSHVSNPPYGIYKPEPKNFESPQSDISKKSEYDRDAPPSPDPSPPQNLHFGKKQIPHVQTANIITHEPVRNNFIQQSPSNHSNIYEKESMQNGTFSPPDVRDDGGSPSAQVVLDKIRKQ